MPEWNLVNVRRSLSKNIMPTALICAMALGTIVLAGCSKLHAPGMQDYDSTGFGGFNQPPVKPSQLAVDPSDQQIVDQLRAKPAQSARPVQSVDQVAKTSPANVIVESEPIDEQVVVKASVIPERGFAGSSPADLNASNSKTPVASEAGSNQSDLPLVPAGQSPTGVRKIAAIQQAANREPLNLSSNLSEQVRTTSYEALVQEQNTEQDAEQDAAAEVQTETEVASDDRPMAEPNQRVTLVARVGNDRALPVNETRLGAVDTTGRPIAMQNTRTQEQELGFVSSDMANNEMPGMSIPVQAVPAAANISEPMSRLTDPITETGYVNQPLRPMLFDEKTRQLNRDYSKTLREPTVRDKMERSVTRQAKAEDSSSINPQVVDFAPANENLTSSTALTPIQGRRSWNDMGDRVANAMSVRENEMASVTDRPMRPIGPTLSPAVSRTAEAIKPIQPTKPIQPLVGTLDSVIPPFAQTPPMDTQTKVESKANVVQFPVVDENAFAQRIPYPVQNEPIEEYPVQNVPGEVIADAEQLVEFASEEIEQMAIEGEFSVDRFPVKTASVEHDAGCAFCDRNENLDLECPACSEGRPLTDTNDFAASQVPSASEISPMVIPPTAVPDLPDSQNTSSDFSAQGTLPVPSSEPYDADMIALTSESTFASPASLMINDDVAPNMTASDIPPVGVDTLMALNNVTWETRLDQTIDLVQKQLGDDDANEYSPSEKTGLEINLRLLQVFRRQMSGIVQSGTELTNNEKQFWHHQLDAITTMLKSADETNVELSDLLRHQTAHQTLDHLRQAVEHLESIANLKVSSGQLCTEITGFGQYKVFPTTSFEVGQRMLVYCEVENYRAIEQESIAGSNFRTKLRGSYAIYDEQGNAVQQAEFPVVEDVARKRRRDFYMYLPVTVGRLKAGNYRLHVLVEDIHGNKTASLDSPISFLVR